MLGTTLWFTVVFGLLGALLVEGAAAYARTATLVAAEAAVTGAQHDALARYQSALALSLARDAAVANIDAALTAPLRGSAPDSSHAYGDAASALATVTSVETPAPGASAPAFTVTTTVTPTTVAPPSCGSGGTGGDTIAWLQCHGLVGESRMSLRIDVAIAAPDGTDTLVRRSETVALRLFAVPPYSVPVGAKDGAANDPAGADASAPAHEGDVGGDTVGGSPPSAQASPWPAGGTLVHVRYRCTDGSPGACANAAPPDPDAALRAGAAWQNGNRPPP